MFARAAKREFIVGRLLRDRDTSRYLTSETIAGSKIADSFGLHADIQLFSFSPGATAEYEAEMPLKSRHCVLF